MRFFPICLFFLSVILIFSCKKDKELNYTTSKVISLDKTISFNSKMMAAGSDSTQFLGLHQYTCPGTNAKGCQTDYSSAPGCVQQVTCPSVVKPENHPSPCNYGSIAYGCFSGAPLGGSPGCSPLVNCQTPPD